MDELAFNFGALVGVHTHEIHYKWIFCEIFNLLFFLHFLQEKFFWLEFILASANKRAKIESYAKLT